MPTQSSPPWMRGSSFGRWAGFSGQDWQVTDRLARHFSEGRLDQEEYDQRIEQAMNATTQSDLHGLFVDLPDDDEPDITPGQAAARPQHHLLLIALVILVAVLLGRVLMAALTPWWLPVALLALLIWHYGRRHRRW
jgi:Flp pilus assembly protein TadB